MQETGGLGTRSHVSNTLGGRVIIVCGLAWQTWFLQAHDRYSIHALRRFFVAYDQQCPFDCYEDVSLVLWTDLLSWIERSGKSPSVSIRCW